MNSVLCRPTNLPARALKQLEHAQHNRNQAKRYAATHHQETLERATSELTQGIVNLTTDLRTLLGVLHARVHADDCAE